MEKLKEYREKIEKIDSQIAKLLEERMNLSKKIGSYKKDNNIPIFDPKREELLKEKNSLLIKEEYRKYYKDLFEMILKISKDIQL